MNDLVLIMEMRKTLTSMNDRLTPYSGKAEHQRYLDNLQHYKKILHGFITRSIDEIDTAIMKSMSIIGGFTKVDNNNIRNQIDGRR
jgi:hypothetical protein